MTRHLEVHRFSPWMRTIPPGDALGVFADRKVDWKNHPGFDMGFAAKNGESGLGDDSVTF